MGTNTTNAKIKVGVVGARGYSGQELCRLLYQHSHVELATIFYNEGKTFSLWKQFPQLERIANSQGKPEPTGSDLESFFKSSSNLDVVFLATPNEVSLELADRFLKHGVSVIDLSGIFRLNQVSSSLSQNLYLKYYGLEHSSVRNLETAIYGFHPFNTTQVQSINRQSPFLVANPGCYVTSVLMAMVPLVRDGLIDESSLIVDAKSGASGAGKKMNENLLFSELVGDFYPYKVLQHQHVPEMEMYINAYAKKAAKVIFTPHLLPVFRGILSTCYLRWSSVIKDLSIEQKKIRIERAYAAHFEGYKLVQWGEMKEKANLVSLKSIAGSCMTHIAYDMDHENLIVFSVIDNLLKGAASQAIENLNSIYGFPSTESLI